jgi:hypothetical protein
MYGKVAENLNKPFMEKERLFACLSVCQTDTINFPDYHLEAREDTFVSNPPCDSRVYFIDRN